MISIYLPDKLTGVERVMVCELEQEEVCRSLQKVACPCYQRVIATAMSQELQLIE